MVVNGNANDEPDDTFDVDLNDAVDATVVKPQGLGTIQDDATPISINSVSQSATNNGTTNFAFTVSLAHASSLPVSVDYATADGTATVVNSAYQAQAGTLTFNPGQTTKTITILVNGNAQPHGDETFFVNLVNPVNGSLVANGQQGTGTILANNNGASYYVNDASTVGDVFCTAPGNNANDGKTPAAPVASLTGLLSLYAFHPGDTIYIDTGAYNLVKNVTLGPAFSGIRIVGAGDRQVTPSVDGRAALADKPVALWRLGDAGGATAADATGNGYNGTYVGNVTADSSAPSNDGAANFDGNGSYVSIPYAPALQPSQFTIEAWVKFDGDEQELGATILSIGSGSLAQWGNNIGFLLYQESPIVSAALPVGTWTYIAVSLDSSGNVLLYVNGSLVAGPYRNYDLQLSKQPLKIGGSVVQAQSWKGDIDEVALYNTVLTPAQIQAHFGRETYTGTVLERGNTATGSYGIELAGATNVSISNLSVTGAAAGIYADAGAGSVGLLLHGVDVYGNGTDVDIESSNDNAAITGSTIHGAGIDGVNRGGEGIHIAANDPTISGNTVYGSITGIYTFGQGPVVADNLVYENDFQGIYMGAFGALIERNDIYANGALDNPGSGIYVGGKSQIDAGSSSNLNTVIDNQVHDNLGGGIETADNNPGLEVGNTVYGNLGAGIEVENGDVRDNTVYNNQNGIIQMPEGLGFGGYAGLNGTFDGNQVHGNTNVGISALVGSIVTGNDVYSNAVGIQGVDLANYDGGSGPGDPFSGTIQNNLVYGNSSTGILISGADEGTVTNNTVYQSRGNAVDVESTLDNTTQNVSLSNNILSAGGSYAIYVANDSQQGFKSNYNLLYTTGTAAIGFWQTGFSNLKDWQFDVGLDPQSITGNPLFVNPAGPDGILGVDPTTGIDGGADDDFHLQNGSPGVAAGNPASDYSKQPAPSGGRINLGAYGDTSQATTTAAVGVIVVQAAGGTEVAVGGSGSFYAVSLTSAPTGNVTIALSHDNPLSLSTTTLTFTPADWSVPQAVTVKQLGPPGIVGDYTVTIGQTVTSTDTRYKGLAIPSVAVKVDNGGPVAQSGTFSLTSATYSVSETAGSETITVSRTGGSAGAVSVSYTTSGGTAIAGTDYTSTSGTLNWAAGDTSPKTFTIPILDDNATGESNETVNIALTNATGGATLGSPGTAILTIDEDNEPSPPASALALTSLNLQRDRETAGSETITVSPPFRLASRPARCQSPMPRATVRPSPAPTTPARPVRSTGRRETHPRRPSRFRSSTTTRSGRATRPSTLR